MAKTSLPTEFSLKVLSPDKKHFDGPAVAVTTQNKEGPFDILAGHVNFFSILSPGTLVIDDGKKTAKLTISGGVAKVSHDMVIIFINI